MPARALLVVSLAAAALAGCGRNAPEDGGPLTGPVVVTREGGVGGIATRLEIGPDGTATLSGEAGDGPVDATDRADPAQLTELQDALAGWEDVDEDQTTDGMVSDLIETTVDYDGHVVRTDDGEDPDDDLARVLDAVAAIEP